MSARSLIERLCAMLACVSLKAVKSGGASQDVVNQFYDGSLLLRELPITIVENAVTPERQASIVQARKQGMGVDVVVVDYLGLMESGERTHNRNDEVSVISRKLKHLAQRYQVVVLALSQLNRDCERRGGDHRPRLSDLRDSGSLEQDADVTLFIHREDYYRKMDNPQAPLDGLAEIIVAKNRNGPTGTVQMVFLDIQMRFADYALGVSDNERT